MSRVDDERDAARAAERLAEAKRTETVRKEKQTAESKAFSRLVQAQKQEAQSQQESNLARKAIGEILKSAEAQKDAANKGTDRGQREKAEEGAAHAKRTVGDQEQEGQKAAKAGARDSKTMQEQGEQGRTQLAQGRKADQSGGATVQSERRGDAKTVRERLEERQESSEQQSGKQTHAARGEKGERKVDSDKGGQQQSGGGREGQEGSPNPSFRFNPALLAPVPVARPKEASGSERLRKIAAELAQKIVERVRLGTNALGRVEFQIDFKSDVLAGLSVSVSAHQGKIKAIFRGHDRDVLKMIEGQGETLKSVLGARGLQLEEFKTEATR